MWKEGGDISGQTLCPIGFNVEAIEFESHDTRLLNNEGSMEGSQPC